MSAVRGDAHALLIRVYKDPAQPLALRVDCAKAALPYEKRRLARVEVKPIGKATSAKHRLSGAMADG
jgi:hypothetical protein